MVCSLSHTNVVGAPTLSIALCSVGGRRTMVGHSVIEQLETSSDRAVYVNMRVCLARETRLMISLRVEPV